MTPENIKQCFSDSITVTDKGFTFDSQTARFIKLSNWNVQNDSAYTPLADTEFQTGHEIYWGFGGKYAHQLFPGKESDWIPILDLANISLRAHPGATITIFYSYLT